MGKGGKSLSPERSFLPQFLLLFTHAFPRPRETAQLGPEGIDAAHVLEETGRGMMPLSKRLHSCWRLLRSTCVHLSALVRTGKSGIPCPAREVREITVQCLRRNPAVEQQG